jgi:peptidoglycan DL-endopeptidase CwlO
MTRVLLSLVLSDLGRDSLKVAAGLALAVLLTLAFAVSSLVSVVAASVPSPTAQPSGTAVEQTVTVSTAPLPGSLGERVIAIARSQLGMPYVLGGASPETSFDCSGLVQWSYRQVGVRLPRLAHQQYAATTRISRSELAPGDMVFFENTTTNPWSRITHVGLYIGDGLMINAPSEGHVVSIAHVFTGYFGAHYAGAGRVGG